MVAQTSWRCQSTWLHYQKPRSQHCQSIVGAILQPWIIFCRTATGPTPSSGNNARKHHPKGGDEEVPGSRRSKGSRRQEQADVTWPFAMHLPCRECAMQKPLKAFTATQDMNRLWTFTVSSGADLVCRKCTHILGMDHVPAKVVYCDGCKTLKTKKDFCDEALTRWMMRLTASIA